MLLIIIDSLPYFPLQAVHAILQREVQADLRDRLALHLEGVGIMARLYLAERVLRALVEFQFHHVYGGLRLQGDV